MAKPAIDLSAVTASDKFELIDELWRSLSPDDLALTPEQRMELDRRLDRLDGDGPSGRPWAEVRTRMANRSK
jgi:putative addiction module component (TIGR02574 family)